MRASASTVMAMKPLTHLNDNDLCYNCRDWLKANKLKLNKFMEMMQERRGEFGEIIWWWFSLFLPLPSFKYQRKKGNILFTMFKWSYKTEPQIDIYSTPQPINVYGKENSLCLLYSHEKFIILRKFIYRISVDEKIPKRARRKQEQEEKRIFHLHDKCMNLLSGSSYKKKRFLYRINLPQVNNIDRKFYKLGQMKRLRRKKGICS